MIGPDGNHKLSSTPEARALPRAETRMVGAGHIGMVAGGQIRSLLYEPLAQWLRDAPT